ncbi:TetR family transcriptional regulator [Mycolicibacterium llatzerense]|uniref:TetR family transcriptional regulator n=1 Tax=Mycolicibacterium llatzerense TaxID=280871 RepID=UPI0005C5D874|nr:TetR family transcriptional regulator [Mycolicibacterium llatzerense]MCT7369811.1 hypothetical protein [Mycolicibacterium llatzerense]
MIASNAALSVMPERSERACGSDRPDDSARSRASIRRRQAILDAALIVAAEGGYQAVQIRAVAECAGIATGTIYRAFASKTHLLAAALTQEFERIESAYDWSSRGTTPALRLGQLTDYLYRYWQREPLLTEAMIRAFVDANTHDAGDLDIAATVIERLLARAFSGTTPTRTAQNLAAVIADIWLANLIAFVCGRASATDTRDRIDRATDRILDRPPVATNNQETLPLVVERYSM